MKTITLITIDAAGTLLKPWPSVGAVYGRIARKKGISVDDNLLDEQFGRAFNVVQKIAHKHQGEEKEFWREVVTITFKPFYEGAKIDELFEELWELFSSGEPWKVADQAFETLDTLLTRGYRLAVLSNNDSRLRSVLEDLKVGHLFEHLFISSELGYEKPQIEMFRAVEKKLQVPPNEIMHLGDSMSRDFTGAKKAGWRPILYGSRSKEINHIQEFPELLSLLP